MVSHVADRGFRICCCTGVSSAQAGLAAVTTFVPTPLVPSETLEEPAGFGAGVWAVA